MSGVWDTLVEIRADIPEAQEIARAEQDIASLYPPPSVQPGFHLTDVVERDGRKFVRLSTMAGGMHFVLRKAAKLGSFRRAVLTTEDRESGQYRYVS
jgi:hypothetical protein